MPSFGRFACTNPHLPSPLTFYLSPFSLPPHQRQIGAGRQLIGKDPLRARGAQVARIITAAYLKLVAVARLALIEGVGRGRIRQPRGQRVIIYPHKHTVILHSTAAVVIPLPVERNLRVVWLVGHCPTRHRGGCRVYRG